ncbi:MAG TPA: protein kinase, partial [Acidisoma sp.]|nr:protein kinase [Acidisoma sp.]
MTLAALRRGDLAGSRVLKLTEGLTEFPPEIFGLAETLEVLDLSGNQLSALPADLGRLSRLRVFFGSGNCFQSLPPSLGCCGNLRQIGCRNAGITEVPAESLPPLLRWLTLTDNAIAGLPNTLGDRPALQKLLLAGNRLAALPEGLAAAPNLELIRISANVFEIWPGWLAEIPTLAWVAVAGNPFAARRPAASHRAIAWSSLSGEAVLGQGASGVVHHMRWQEQPGQVAQSVAVKLFKGAMTSDGIAADEMAAMLAAGAHPNLTAPLGVVAGHPAGTDGLVMPLLPEAWRALAAPPSSESCTRDVYDPRLRLNLSAGLRLARGAADALRHLHVQGLAHGDLYAHNLLWDGDTGDCVVSDFGAAGFCPVGAEPTTLQRVEVRAWGILAAEIAARC